MKKLIFLVALMGIASIGLAQQFSAKINLGSLVLRNVPVSVEYRTGDRMSANLQVGYLIPRDVTGLLEIATETSLPTVNLQGFSIMPEYRFYLVPFKTSEYLSGMYLAPIVRYQRYSVTTGFAIDTLDMNVDLEGTYSTIRPGAQLGFQWVLGDHFVIDWFLLGVTANITKFSGEVSTDKPVIDVEQLEQEFVDRYGDLPLGISFSDLGLQGTLQSYSGSLRNVGVGVRTGISVGIAF